MLVSELTALVLQKLSISSSLIIKKKYNKTPEWSAELLVSALISSSSAEDARNLLVASNDTINLYTNKLFNNRILKPKGQRTWSISILDFIGYKLCDKCSNYKVYNDFHKSSYKAVGVSTNCKNCCAAYNRQYYLDNTEASLAKGALYRARKLQAIPAWADTVSIEQFYAKCPEGYHVDHILPLAGEKVCGLHVLNNLQYLSVRENLQKGNKQLIDC